MSLMGLGIEIGVNVLVGRRFPGIGGAMGGGALGAGAAKLYDNGGKMDGVLDTAVKGGVMNTVFAGAASGAGFAAKKAAERAGQRAATKAAASGPGSHAAAADQYDDIVHRWPIGRSTQLVRNGDGQFQNLTKSEVEDLAKASRAQATAGTAGLTKRENILKIIDEQMKWGKKAKDLDPKVPTGWGNLGTRAGLSALFVDGPGWGGGDSDGNGGKSKEKPETEAIDFQWVGAGAAGSKMGTEPFTQVAGITPHGDGFLLQPLKGLDEAITKWHGGDTDSVAKAFVDGHELFGDPKLKEKMMDEKKPQQMAKIPPLHASLGSNTGSGASEYGKLVGSLNGKATKFNNAQANVVMVESEIDKITTRGQGNVATTIGSMNDAVQSMTAVSNEAMLKLMISVLNSVGEEIEGANQQTKALADQLAEQKKALEDDKAAADDLEDRTNNLPTGTPSPTYPQPGSPTGTQTDTPDSSLLPDIDPADYQTPDTPGVDPGDSNSDLNPGDNSLTNPGGSSTDPSGLGGPGYNSPITTPSTGGMGGGFGDAMSALPLMSLLQGGLNRDRQLADTDGMRDIDPSRYERAAAPNMPQPQQAGTTPWSNNQAAANNAATQAQPAHHQTGAPNGATSNQTGAGVPRRVPGDDGLVPYSFPDGRSQRVSPTRAQGLDKAFANKSGTDAQAAYAGTAAAWTDPKNIGLAMDPSQVKTGDVATWTISRSKDDSKVPAGAQAVMSSLGGDLGSAEDESGDPKQSEQKTEEPKADPEFRTAVLVAFGEGESGTLEAVVAGELQQYSPDMTDAEGPFGDFAGFKRPNGLEAAGDTGQDVDGAADPSATDVPALAPA
ncbi:hypothetical protein [Nocardia sp. NPDC024068]|uniref:hypothetical protein n=1 Tax=Nocardia sp. NPDC024068 TaxID=3157197 RepID=UPI0033D77885